MLAVAAEGKTITDPRRHCQRAGLANEPGKKLPPNLEAAAPQTIYLSEKI